MFSRWREAWFAGQWAGEPTISAYIAILLGMVVVSDLGLFSVADGVMYALLTTLVFPSMAVYFLVAICTYQDAAGLSTFWWYAGTLLFSLIVIIQWTRRYGFESLRGSGVGLLSAATLCVIIYAVLISILQIALDGHPQSGARPPLVVGGLMAWMSLAGISAASVLFRLPDSGQRLKFLVAILVANGLIVAIAKAVIGVEVFASATGLEQVQDATQLIEPSALGIPRLIGTYLTPNGFALCYGLLLLLLLLGKGSKRVSDDYTYGYVLIGGLLSIFSFSKAMAAFFALTSVIFLWQSRRAKYVVAVWGLLSLGGVVVYSGIDAQTLLDAFRVPSEGSEDLGYRGEAWTLVMQRFSFSDWLFGTGLSYWPQLFEQNLGYSLSDPHTYLLSIPGTYGLAGIALYLLLGILLLNVARTTTGAERALALGLLVLFFIKDLASIPYLIGNTPLTLLIWILLAGALNSKFGAGRSTAKV